MKIKKRGNKKGVSPVIATVLLIALVVVLALIIFLWARGFIKEIVEKDIGGVTKTAEKFCSEVNLDVSISASADEVYIVNRGNIPVYKINLKKATKGSSDIQEEVLNMGIGKSETVTVSSVVDYNEIIIIPVLLGKAKNEEKEQVCKEKYGIECVNKDGSFVC